MRFFRHELTKVLARLFSYTGFVCSGARKHQLRAYRLDFWGLLLLSATTVVQK
jgi:hypothetical protein